MIEAGFVNCKWLNIKKLAGNLIQSNQVLIEIKYFTSRVSNNPDKQKRQTTYIEALESVGVKIFYGHYKSDTTECRKCGNIWPTFHKKMTDVNIATQMMVDAFENRFDMAMLISGDSDLVPPIKTVHVLFNNKRVFVAFPPKRHNSSVALVAKGSMMIGRKKFIDSLFESEITKRDGFILRKPKEWI